MSSSAALIKRQDEDMALMPPPPTKRTKRPATVLDEDDYTNALSDIIARDYFPGLAEVKAQEEYLTALEADNDVWIREAGQKLKQTMTPLPNRKGKPTSQNNRSDIPGSWTTRTPVPDTPRGSSTIGGETPLLDTSSHIAEEPEHKPQIVTSNLSLTSFQAKYTSEDNESFNTLLDKQNNHKRKKNAYLWTSDQLIPSHRLLTYRNEQSKLIEARSNHEALAAKHNETALIPLTTGATSSRPASVQSWKSKTPNNSLMFPPEGIDDSGLQTIMEAKEAASKAGPKETVFANTRFQPQYLYDDDRDQHSIPPSPSLNTQIIARRDIRRAEKPFSEAPTEASFDGGETPRVNGYTFVDEDEPENLSHPSNDMPTYRDLLAGQTGDSTPNPFKISETRRREDLHFRLVAKEQATRRAKDLQTVKTPGGTGVGGASTGANMTPAARNLMEKIGRTPINVGRRQERMSSKEMWTPGATPRRKR